MQISQLRDLLHYSLNSLVSTLMVLTACRYFPFPPIGCYLELTILEGARNCTFSRFSQDWDKAGMGELQYKVRAAVGALLQERNCEAVLNGE